MLTLLAVLGEAGDAPMTPRRGQGVLHVSGSSTQSTTLVTTAVSATHINYELVGVIVHSGQANAGHYYSYIKDRRLVSTWAVT